MKEHPIIFSGPMVNAILEGRKTQTRRVIRNPERLNGLMLPGEEAQWCPYGQPGDRLWVRESFQDYCAIWQGHWCGHGRQEDIEREHGVMYRSGPPHRAPLPSSQPLKWQPSIHMPRWASRLMLEITGVRVERVQDISIHDIMAEGIEFAPGARFSPRAHAAAARSAFSTVWDSINAKRGYGWEGNPWVWVISFKRMEQPSGD